MTLYVGLMSGTSIDGVDAVLAEIGDGRPRVIATHTQPLPGPLREALESLVTGKTRDAHLVWRLDAEVGEVFADATEALLAGAGIDRGEVRAIGSHGQTIHHDPDARPAISVQIGDPNRIAERTGITTVADFRRRDMAAGGQGAPLAPAFHAAAFSTPGLPRAVLNLGGIANLTVLPGDERPVIGFDTGPANTLLDTWCRRHLGQPCDRDGAWAARGNTDQALLAACLGDPYFRRPPPKSTGRERFNAGWLDARLAECDQPGIDPRDVQRTLCELSATTAASAVRDHAAEVTEVLVCGGGARNPVLMAALADRLAPIRVATTATLGVPPEWVEGLAFAWLAMRTLAGEPGNLPSVTGARHPAVLGAIHPG